VLESLFVAAIIVLIPVKAAVRANQTDLVEIVMSN